MYFQVLIYCFAADLIITLSKVDLFFGESNVVLKLFVPKRMQFYKVVRVWMRRSWRLRPVVEILNSLLSIFLRPVLSRPC